MDFYYRKNTWKLVFFLFAVAIGAATLWYTESFLKELRAEEEKKVNQWAMAMNEVSMADKEDELTLAVEILEGADNIPIIITDANGQITETKNISERRLEDTEWLYQRMEEMAVAHEPLDMIYLAGETYKVYYDNSLLLTKMRYYPMVLLVVIFIFVMIAYVAFSNARRAEQDQVWNGLAKETAHQIGTPLTSLLGWLEMLRMQPENAEMVSEMQKDIDRLHTITDRFSKIGSTPNLSVQYLDEVVRESVDYMQNRTPKRIKIELKPLEEERIEVKLNKPLFEWVIENLIRNALDAIQGQGDIDIMIKPTAKTIRIDVRDTGKGIPSNKQKTVFRPGFTTKKRGWGLGLSLAKRIVEEYHHGKIYVANSQLNVGTTFRIVLNRA